MISAVFFPVDPEALAYDMQATVSRALRSGLKLYRAPDGRFALLPKRLPGWFLFCGGEKPCAG